MANSNLSLGNEYETFHLLIFSVQVVIRVGAEASWLPDIQIAAKKNLGVILEKSMGGGGGDQGHLFMHQRLNNYRK